MKDPPPPLVLIASEEEWSGRSLATILSAHGFAVLRAATADEVCATARGAQPDAVLIHLRVAETDGIALCRRLRDERLVDPCAPVILVMRNPPTRARSIEAYQAGAWDLYHPPVDAELLSMRLGHLLSAKREADRIRENGLIDQVTGLYNLRGVARRARELVANCQRAETALAFVSVAPDVPVTSGALDQEHRLLVEQLGDALARSVRASDAIGHVGRAEFAVVAPATSPDGAARLVERLQAAVTGIPIGTGKTERPVHLHCGVSVVDLVGSESVDPLELLQRASTEMQAQRSLAPPPPPPPDRPFLIR